MKNNRLKFVLTSSINQSETFKFKVFLVSDFDWKIKNLFNQFAITNNFGIKMKRFKFFIHLK